MKQLVITGAGELRIIHLHPAFFARSVKKNEPSIGRKVHDIAHDTTIMMSDLVIRQGSKVLYEKHYGSPKPIPVQKVDKKERIKELKAIRREVENKQFSFCDRKTF